MPRAKGKGGRPKKNKNKLKTKRVCRRKLSITGTGQVVKGKIGIRKLMRNKTKSNKRQNNKKGILYKGFAKMVKRCFLHIKMKLKKKK
jgi:ribosomal protein L35